MLSGVLAELTLPSRYAYDLMYVITAHCIEEACSDAIGMASCVLGHTPVLSYAFMLLLQICLGATCDAYCICINIAKLSSGISMLQPVSHAWCAAMCLTVRHRAV